MQGLRSKHLQASLARKAPSDLSDMMKRAERYMNAEELLASQKEPERGREAERSRDTGKGKGKEPSRARTSPRRGPEVERPAFTSRYNNYTPLTTRRSEILLEIQNSKNIKWPSKMQGNPEKRDKSKYCYFHRDHGHTTNECIKLKDEIEALIRRGHLDKFIAQGGGNRDRERSPRRREEEPALGVLTMIAGGPAAGGESSAGRKKYARSLEGESNTKRPRFGDEVTFTDQDAEGLVFPHSDPVVITVRVANYDVQRILVDSGSSVDVLFLETFLRLGLDRARLRPARSNLVGFTGDGVTPEGIISLPVRWGDGPKHVNATVDFLVIDRKSAYNIILGRPSLNQIRAVVSTYHLAVKFPTSGGVATVKGNQRAARECYVASLKPKTDEALQIDVPEQSKDRASPAEELVEIELSDPTHKVKIGSTAEAGLAEKLGEVLTESEGTFAWSTAQMRGVDPKLIVHRLNVDPDFKPVRQKRRPFAPERNQIIHEEVEKLLEVGHIREVEYPTWLANVVLVPKPGGKWRMCIDFTDLNRACPKDCFPLPRIDQLVDATSGYEYLSFMDAFKGYNQIRMAPADEEKTSFVTDRGLYCYRVMPFGLKNAGATYQRMVNQVFKHQIGRNMEVYVDDMLVKSTSAATHAEDLREALAVMDQYGIKLNPEKCAFGVRAGKFIGFMVTRRGIETNPKRSELSSTSHHPEP